CADLNAISRDSISDLATQVLLLARGCRLLDLVLVDRRVVRVQPELAFLRFELIPLLAHRGRHSGDHLPGAPLRDSQRFDNLRQAISHTGEGLDREVGPANLGIKSVSASLVAANLRKQTQHRRPALSPQSVQQVDRKSTRLNSSHVSISYAVFCLKKKRLKTMIMRQII